MNCSILGRLGFEPNVKKLRFLLASGLQRSAKNNVAIIDTVNSRGDRREDWQNWHPVNPEFSFVGMVWSIKIRLDRAVA